MDAILRDSVSPFLGNFFLLLLQSSPLETLNIKLLPNFSHPSSARFPRVLRKQRNNCSFHFQFHLTVCMGAVQYTSEGRALSTNPRPVELCSQLPLCTYFMDKYRKTSERMTSKAGKPVWFHLWLH